ncbi:MAG: hypothetical protein RR482_08285 [Clostridia bacterium]
MLLWINDQIIGRADEKPEDKNHNDGNGDAGSAKGDSALTDDKKDENVLSDTSGVDNSFSKSRKKSKKAIRRMNRKLPGYLGRDLESIQRISDRRPGCLPNALPKKKLERLAAILLRYKQQKEMYDAKTHHVADRIVSLSQPWVRPIVRGKQNADVEFGTKIEMSVVDGYLRVEDMRWDAYNESTTL